MSEYGRCKNRNKFIKYCIELLTPVQKNGFVDGVSGISGYVAKRQYNIRIWYASQEKVTFILPIAVPADSCIHNYRQLIVWSPRKETTMFTTVLKTPNPLFLYKNGPGIEVYRERDGLLEKLSDDEAARQLDKLREENHGRYPAGCFVYNLNISAYSIVITRDRIAIDLVRLGKRKCLEGHDRPVVRDCIIPKADLVERRITTKLNATIIDDYIKYSNPFLDFIVKNVHDKDTLIFLLTFIFTALHGNHGFKMILVIYNVRKNSGKSVFVSVLQKLFGDYAIKINASLLDASEDKNLQKKLYRHRFARLVIADELEVSNKLNTSFLKKMTGGDTQDNPYQKDGGGDWMAPRTLVIDTNQLPHEWVATDSELASRVFVIPFGASVPLSDRDPDLLNRLTQQESLDVFFSFLTEVFS